ncbi:hypothetical protein RHMOL_Rhmol01G0193400 [Rhododendron molle]|uniref:Uncharacterized protein n=1 Tax=Rhododendron molle TaxID=49168 RepID=A0ACC0Q2W8_RHOML|nr:hypothetical protein RHMOL_Rhmol01G0193400 [Rhododendron molle]
MIGNPIPNLVPIVWKIHKRSNRFGENDVDGEKEGKGSASSVDDSFHLLTDMEIVHMTFVSEDEAGQFYNAYAKAIGFSVRKYKSRRQTGNEMYVRWRVWVCSREGQRNKKHLERTNRKRRHKAETRTGCGAKFRVCLMSPTVTNYVVTEFVSAQNHPLAAPQCVPFMQSHRHVGDANIAQVMAMRNVGMKAAEIMDYMTCQSGGFQNVGFTVKDLRNKLQSSRKEEIRNGDAEGALGFLAAQVSTDPLFFFKYTVDEDDRLETLLWTYGRSQMDYAAFGDVLVFDTTYRTNAYKKPFVILAGVSNNFTTTIFGCALLSKEAEDTYNWVLSTFLEAMDGKRPISVVIDGDLAMRNAIRDIFPDARHRLCSWHLERNAAKNVHIPEFVSDFTTLMQMECDVEEFETIWADMVSHCGLQTNAWVVEMYCDRERWAKAYLLGHFFARMRSTQRCEESNWTVEYYPIDSRMNCSCLMFESFGLPCCHMIVVMKYEHLSSIPPSLVMQRWTRSARPPVEQPNIDEISRSIYHMARYGILSSGYKLMSFYAAHAQDSFEDARQVEHKMTSWMRKWWEMRKNKDCNAEIGEPSDGNTLFGVSDPPVVKTKGNPGKKSSSNGACEKENSDSTPPPALRRSKRLAKCTPVVISVDESTDGRGDEENNVSYSGECYDEMNKSVSQGDTESDSDCEKNGESESDSESDSHSGAIKLPNLSAFASRPVIEERSVALGKLRKLTRVPELLKDLGLHPICKYAGRANWTLVREFFAGINPFEVDQVERIMLSTVRGHTIRLTPDRLAQFKKIARPHETEKQYSYLPGVERPSFHDIWMTMCHGSWPPEDTEDNPNPKILLNILKKDFVLLHHIFWWNVYPKSPRREVNAK